MKIIKILSIITLVVLMSSCNNKVVTNKSLETETDSLSYAVGMSVGQSVKQSFKDDFDSDIFYQAYNAVVDSTDLLIDKEMSQQIIQTIMQKKQAEAQIKQREDAEKKALEQFGDVKAAGEKFLEENMTKEGVEITESGLQYIVMKEGDGEKPESTSKIKIHYHGTLTDGTVFDSSVDKGTPYESLANQFIPGFSEGLLLMPEGSKYKFFIPQDIAYGAFPRQGGVIKPFAALVFEVELLEIVK